MVQYSRASEVSIIEADFIMDLTNTERIYTDVRF